MNANAARQLEAACAAHGRTVRRYASAWPAVADDAAQEAFVRLARHLAAGRPPPADVRAWLLVAVRSAATDLGRSAWRRRRRERVSASTGEAFAVDPGPPADPEVHAALERLDPRRREAVVLRLWCGLTVAAAAEVLGVAPSTFHALYHAALSDLRRLLADLDPRRP